MSDLLLSFEDTFATTQPSAQERMNTNTLTRIVSRRLPKTPAKAGFATMKYTMSAGSMTVALNMSPMR